MTGKALVDSVLARKNTGKNPFWLGNPADETKLMYAKALGISVEFFSGTSDSALYTSMNGIIDIELAKKTGGDMVWFTPELDASSYRHPDNKPMWDCFKGEKRKSLLQAGVFAEVESVRDIEAFDWPNPEFIDLEKVYNDAVAANDAGLAVFGGMWSPFFHVLADFFGMDNYFMKMHTDPEIVLAATEHVVDFYLAANARCLDKMGHLLSAGFFGNDLGTQRAMMISPECYNRFIHPYLKKIAALIKDYGLPVAIHCCGAIYDIIPSFIELGVDVLHPLQALAAGMAPENIQRDFGKDLVFMGGVDTQNLLPFGTVQDVEHKVAQLREIFGPNYIVSPSHEALLPNVALEKVMAMSKAAKA